MTDTLQTTKTEPAGLLDTTINILVSPREAFIELKQRPRKLFPLVLLLGSTSVALLLYFYVVDFDWYIDDILATENIDEDQLEQSREAMTSVGKNSFMMIGILTGTVSALLLYALQAGYLSLISALTGDGQKFSNWFSLVLWTALPNLFAVAGMFVTIMLSTNGQLSLYDLNPLTLTSLGMESSNSSLNTIFSLLNLTMVWSITLTTMGYRQWLDISMSKAIAVIASPYLLMLMLVVWANSAFA